MALEEIIWLAQRTYRVRDGGDEVRVALAAPRKLAMHERTLKSDADAFGCLVQTGADYTRHFVCGRDEMEALFHALLAVERFLLESSRKRELVNSDGRPFDPSGEGLLAGPMGREYIRELGG